LTTFCLSVTICPAYSPSQDKNTDILTLERQPWSGLDMAAIIAQITRNKRERERKESMGPRELTKCMHDLPEYETKFNPKVHNKYLAR
jgi:hypothetical protein